MDGERNNVKGIISKHQLHSTDAYHTHQKKEGEAFSILIVLQCL